MESEGHAIDPRIRGIAENRDVLLEALDVNPVLLTELSGHAILDECTKQRITSEKKYDINERFVGWLETSPSQTIDIVLQKLRDDKQHHVANLIDGTDGERPLSTKAKQRIRKLIGWLTKNMTTDHGLIDQLFSREAISSRDCEDIKAKPTESARAMELIDVILRRSDRTMKRFLEALMASNQRHIAQVLEKDEMIELCLRPTCSTADQNLLSSSKTDKDEEMQRKLKTISSHNFALAVVKANNDIIIYVLCEDGDDRRMLEELFQSSQHRAIIVEELIKVLTSDTKAKNPLESEVLQLIQDFLAKVGHSEIVLRTGANCGRKCEHDRISNSRSPGMKKSSLEMDDNNKSEQMFTSPEQGHAVSPEEMLCRLEKSSDIEDPEKEKIDLGRWVDLGKAEDITVTKKTEDTEMKRLDGNTCKRKSEAEHKKPKNQVDLTVDDGAKESIDPLIPKLKLKLKLVEKERDRKISEITWLRERLKLIEEEKDEISKDLTEILKNLDTGERDQLIIDLKQRVRRVEKDKDKLSTDLAKALFAQQQTENELRDLKEQQSKHSYNLHTASLLNITKEIKTEANESSGWSELMNCIELATDVALNKKSILSLCLLIFRNTKSHKEALAGIMMITLWALPVCLHLPVGIPDTISSFCFTNISGIFWGWLIIAIVLIWDRQNLLPVIFVVGRVADLYLSNGGFGPGVGVGRYCHEDKCVYTFCWNYLSDNMRIEEAPEQIPAQHYNEPGGLFKSPASFAVWSKYTSHRWDKEIREYALTGRFIRKVYTKPVLGTSPFHYLTEFRLSTGLVSAGHGSLFYDDPMLRLCLLDTNGNTIKSFGGQQGPVKGVPAVLDVDREGCVIAADQKSGKMIAICSDKECAEQLRAKVNELNNPFEMCLHS